ncbi:MAG: DeoR/GlpR transcriptional regulator [Anaerolineales bacterium]|uniref:DeoR/GlpR family DNA-binding transcription regulator n=1 Tax=Candidatus Villigracilis affinis TaxID=3140682 RepID=UPI001D663B1A|nr:DeoR/GlpR transcriptional regulator [Anaerolineales bacterium]MBK9603326.1 DeoR/GlpR transcriptional regulator [Anaerolineales bacterium]
MSEFTPTPERQKQILSLLTRQGRLSVTEIVEQFSISEATARRDLESLASQGKAQRVHGGVIAVEQAPPELPILQREGEQADEKSMIGQAAAELVNDGETVFLGSGTTVLETAKNLRERKNLTVITNSLPVLNALAGIKEITVVSLGGQLRESELSFIGHITEQALAEVRVDKVIMGARGLSLEHGLTNDYLQETLTDRAILKIGHEVILVADHSKVNRVSTALLAPLSSMNTFVTDSKADKKFIQALKKQNIKVVIA